MSFNDKSNFKKHNRIHTGDRPFVIRHFQGEHHSGHIGEHIKRIDTHALLVISHLMTKTILKSIIAFILEIVHFRV